MFERYTEKARRVLFFARYEASQFGSLSIETEHMLLGLVREGKGLTSRLFQRAGVSLDTIRGDLEARTVFTKKVSTSVEIPFSVEVKRAMQHAAEEADKLLHSYIGTEHLLLGLLREERSVACAVLASHGLQVDSVRDDIVTLLNDTASRPARTVDIAQQVERLKGFVGRLGELAGDNAEAATLTRQILLELDVLKPPRTD